MLFYFSAIFINIFLKTRYINPKKTDTAIIDAPDDKFKLKDTVIPKIQEIKLHKKDISIIDFMVFAEYEDKYGGIDKSAITKIIPTSCMSITTAIAISIIISK